MFCFTFLSKEKVLTKLCGDAHKSVSPQKR